MTECIRYSEEVLGWVRKPGPLRVWRIVEGRKKTDDGKTLRFSIQEIPEDRYNDVLEHMSTIFARDESICHSQGVINIPGAISDFCKIWSFALQQGCVVGAFLVDENNPKPPLAGANLTVVNCEASEKGFAQVEFESKVTQSIFKFMGDLDKKKCTRKMYDVDKYIMAFGLSVDPIYRGQGLGLHLLKARDEMSVAYDIQATSTIFTSARAQNLAAQADFQLLAEENYADARNEDGSEIFPGISQKSCKLMGKSFK